ncbi:hypothetical protein ACWCQE_40435, partial [Streptomyces sp. NPDC002409]
MAAVAAIPPVTEPKTGVHLWDAKHGGRVSPMGETESTGTNEEKLERLIYHPDGDLLAGAGED